MPNSQNHNGQKNLDMLIQELSLDERNNFLEKLKMQTNLTSEPLYERVNDREKSVNPEILYTWLPWYARFFYFLMSLFKGTRASNVYEDMKFDRYGRKIQSTTHKLFNYEKKQLLSEFYDLTFKLKEAARFFFTALDSSVNQDKGGFYAFMGSLEMGVIHTMLQNAASQNTISDIGDDAKESELRSTMTKNMEKAFGFINDAQRNIMYNNARSLICLKELSSFTYDRLLLSFEISGSNQICSLSQVKEMLLKLSNILYSLKNPPSLSLLETLFVFMLEERKDDEDFDMDREMRSLLVSAENAIETIRDFNKKIPIIQLLRFIYRDMSLTPKQIPGGEDWFSVYQEHWKRQMESVLGEFIQRRKHQEISASFKELTKGADLNFLKYAASFENPNGFPLPEASSLSILRTFHSAVFMTGIDAVAHSIIIEGRFFKQENRTEFSEAVSNFMRIEESIYEFENKLSPGGEYGNRFERLKMDESNEAAKKRKTQLLFEESSREARGINIRSVTMLMSMANVLDGILDREREPGAAYDGLINLDRMGGKDSEAFINNMKEAHGQLQGVLQILKETETGGSAR